MDLQKLTEKSLEGLRGAQGLAVRRSNQGVDVEHLLRGSPANGLGRDFGADAIAGENDDLPAHACACS